jgi:hypothetical protein
MLAISIMPMLHDMRAAQGRTGSQARHMPLGFSFPRDMGASGATCETFGCCSG